MIQAIVVFAVIIGIYQCFKAGNLQSRLQDVQKPVSLFPDSRYGATTLTMVGAPVQTTAPITEAAYYARSRRNPSYLAATNDPETLFPGVCNLTDPTRGELSMNWIPDDVTTDQGTTFYFTPGTPDLVKLETFHKIGQTYGGM